MVRPPLFVHDSRTPGPPVVLLHGFGGNRSTFRFWVDDLSRSHRVIQVDLKGFGEAPRPRDGRYSPADQADHVEAMFDSMDLRHATLVGHSLGGGISLLLALRLVARDSCPLAGLVLVASAAYPQSIPRFMGLARVPILGRVGARLIPPRWLMRKVLEEITFERRPIDALQVDNYARPLSRPGARHSLLETARQIVPRDLDRITDRYDQISVPSLVLWGRQDPVVPLRIGERLSRVLPDSELVVLDRCGHIPPEERPAESLAALRSFLSRSSGSSGSAREEP